MHIVNPVLPGRLVQLTVFLAIEVGVAGHPSRGPLRTQSLHQRKCAEMGRTGRKAPLVSKGQRAPGTCPAHPRRLELRHTSSRP